MGHLGQFWWGHMSKWAVAAAYLRVSPNSFFIFYFYFYFLYYICEVLLWILNELKWWRQCTVSEFMVSKTWFKIIVSWLEQILVQTLRENLSHISRHLESQFQNFRVHVCCRVWHSVTYCQKVVPFSTATTTDFIFIK